MLLGRDLFFDLWFRCSEWYHLGLGLPGWFVVHWSYLGPPSHSAFFYLSFGMIRLTQRFCLLCQLLGMQVLACVWHHYLQVVSLYLQ